MNILAWPFGSYLIIQKISELDPKQDKSLYNKKSTKNCKIRNSILSLSCSTFSEYQS